MLRHLIFPLLFLAATLPVAAETMPSDSTHVAPRLGTTDVQPRQFIFPATALALGGACVGNHLIDTSAERPVHRFDDALQYVPIGGYVALGFIPGVAHRHRIGDRVLAGATAYIAMTALVQGTKRLVSEPRPDTGATNSFPSGHTATAFCGAELCRIEYGNAYGAAAYAFAITTGVMRVANRRHWCNDVLAGAGIGFLSAHIGYWLLPLEHRAVNRLTGRRRGADATASTFLLAPTYEPLTKSPSLALEVRF